MAVWSLHTENDVLEQPLQRKRSNVVESDIRIVTTFLLLYGVTVAMATEIFHFEFYVIFKFLQMGRNQTCEADFDTR